MKKILCREFIVIPIKSEQRGVRKIWPINDDDDDDGIKQRQKQSELFKRRKYIKLMVTERKKQKF